MFFNLDALPHCLGRAVFILDVFVPHALFLWLWATFLRRPVRRSFCLRFRERGHSLCIEFDYRLRGRIEAADGGACADPLDWHCPECGAEFDEAFRRNFRLEEDRSPERPTPP